MSAAIAQTGINEVAGIGHMTVAQSVQTPVNQVGDHPQLMSPNTFVILKSQSRYQGEHPTDGFNLPPREGRIAFAKSETVIMLMGQSENDTLVPANSPRERREPVYHTVGNLYQGKPLLQDKAREKLENLPPGHYFAGFKSGERRLEIFWKSNLWEEPGWWQIWRQLGKSKNIVHMVPLHEPHPQLLHGQRFTTEEVTLLFPLVVTKIEADSTPAEIDLSKASSPDSTIPEDLPVDQGLRAIVTDMEKRTKVQASQTPLPTYVAPAESKILGRLARNHFMIMRDQELGIMRDVLQCDGEALVTEVVQRSRLEDMLAVRAKIRAREIARPYELYLSAEMARKYKLHMTDIPDSLTQAGRTFTGILGYRDTNHFRGFVERDLLRFSMFTANFEQDEEPISFPLWTPFAQMRSRALANIYEPYILAEFHQLIRQLEHYIIKETIKEVTH